jgi:hypothetical protein
MSATRRLLVAIPVVVIAFGAPAVAMAHQLSRSFESRLPLAVYLAGAAGAVALSFAFVLLRDVSFRPPRDDGRRRMVPAWLRGLVRAVGLIGWAWIMAQAVAGGGSDAEVSRLFAWNYGWVGVAVVSAFALPIWTWLDPFSTLHAIGARLLRAVGVDGAAPAPYPERLGTWPAVAGFAVVIWLELAAGGAGSRTLGLVIAGYTAYTLAMMAQFGRTEWRSHGEIFSVWFGLLGRLAPYAAVGGSDHARLRRRDFASGLLEGGWALPDVVMIALGTGSILFDGLSQTQVWFDRFGAPGVLPQTLLLAGFLTLIVGAALLVSRLVGIPGTGAGLLPIAVGYLIAHYFTFLVIDGQRIVIALSDPLQRGSNLLGTAFFEPSGAWLPPGFVWTLQLAAVVGGHMIGAWAGHVAAARSLGAGREVNAVQLREIRRRQVPLAIVMVALTTLTLWSLGQALFIPRS